MLLDQPSSNLLPASRQLLLVVARHWESRGGQLQRFARGGVDGAWLRVGNPVAVSLGRSGLAWGRGLYRPVDGVGPEKCEGDGRAPAGIFRITALFGDGSADSRLARAAKLPYLCATSDLKCVDDPTSVHYNRIVDQSRVGGIDWNSGEDMLRGDDRYALGAVVGCNCDPVLPAAGSCIFLHVWQAPGVPTAGCTALALADMKKIAGWLDGAKSPLLVQLPRGAFKRMRVTWGLPDRAD